jgi:hypothetical protein
MEEQKALLNEAASESYDAADRPFDFVVEGGATALVCEPDPAGREKISEGLKEQATRLRLRFRRRTPSRRCGFTFSTSSF